MWQGILGSKGQRGAVWATHPATAQLLCFLWTPSQGLCSGAREDTSLRNSRHFCFKCVVIQPASVSPVFASLPDVSQVTREPPRLVANPRGSNFLGFAEGLLPWNHVYPPYTPTHRHSNTLPGTEHVRCRAACGGKRVVAGVCLYSVLSLSNWNTASTARLCWLGHESSGLSYYCNLSKTCFCIIA